MVAKPEPISFAAAKANFADGSDSPTALLDRCIARIEADDGEIGAFVTTNLDGARAAASSADARYKAGAPLSEIDGMPVGIKDIMETADMPTDEGSDLFVGRPTHRDAAAVAALREAGAVVVGKTVTTEFASTHPGGTRNPWDLERTPGGSSSGSAAGVAAGMMCGALGSQVIGSTVRPAGYCGIYGYKPSAGGINRGGSFDEFSQSCTGIIAASLEETWTMTRAITSRSGGDPGHPGVLGPMNLPAARTPQRVAFLQTDGWANTTDDAKAQLADVRGRLESAGFEIVDRDNDLAVAGVETAIEGAGPLSLTINAWEGRWPLNTYARDMDAEKLSQSARDRLVEAEAMSQEEFQQLLTRREHARTVWATLQSAADVAITLTAPGPAPVGIDWTGDPSFAVPGSLLGIPTMSLPVLQTENLPLGLQLMGFVDEDATLFAHAGGVLAAL